jgi:hypothetical protein
MKSRSGTGSNNNRTLFGASPKTSQLLWASMYNNGQLLLTAILSGELRSGF